MSNIQTIKDLTLLDLKVIKDEYSKCEIDSRWDFHFQFNNGTEALHSCCEGINTEFKELLKNSDTCILTPYLIGHNTGGIIELKCSELLDNISRLEYIID